jgi:hypothetical protein
MQNNTQQLIISILGVALFMMIYMKYNQDIIIAIVSGLIGFLTNKTLTEYSLDNNNTQESTEKDTSTQGRGDDVQ